MSIETKPNSTPSAPSRTRSGTPSGVTFSALSEAQINYMQTVLGIDGVLLPIMATPDSQEFASSSQTNWRQTGEIANAKFHVLIASDSDEFPLQGEAEALALKMFQAMKIPLSQIVRLEWHSGGLCPSEIQAIAQAAAAVLIMGQNTARYLSEAKMPIGELHQWSGKNVLVTYSPSALLQSPDLKKMAWAHLQTFMKVL
jgi:hypothetical protein